MKVSVIVPVYNVAKFIERCVVSLMAQTLNGVEYIFVDDASPDNSIQILEEVINRYPKRREQVRIVRHKDNQGLPAARNTGLAEATGEYIFHCDSDDFVESNMLAELYAAALKYNADIVWCDFFLSYEKKERYMKQPEYYTAEDALRGMLSGAMKYNVWNKLVRRNLYVDNDIKFPSGYGMGEDMTMLMLYSCASTVRYVPGAFYHYVKLNTEAFSQTYSEKHLMELRYNVNRVYDYLNNKYGDILAESLCFFKLDIKYPFLISDDVTKYRLWQDWYPEVNGYIWKNKNVSLRSRVLQWLASKGQFWLVWIYYKLVYQFLYGVIYR